MISYSYHCNAPLHPYKDTHVRTLICVSLISVFGVPTNTNFQGLEIAESAAQKKKMNDDENLRVELVCKYTYDIHVTIKISTHMPCI